MLSSASEQEITKVIRSCRKLEEFFLRATTEYVDSVDRVPLTSANRYVSRIFITFMINTGCIPEYRGSTFKRFSVSTSCLHGYRFHCYSTAARHSTNLHAKNAILRCVMLTFFKVNVPSQKLAKSFILTHTLAMHR